MDEKEKSDRLEAAITGIIPIVTTLSYSEWSRIIRLVDHFYNSKAAKVQLDGSDLEKLKENLISEFIS